MEQEDREELAQLNDSASKMLKLLNSGSMRGNNVSTMNIQAGGIGLWIAVTCCIVMVIVGGLAVGAGTAAYLSMKSDIHEQDRKIDRLQDYQNVTIRGQKP